MNPSNFTHLKTLGLFFLLIIFVMKNSMAQYAKLLDFAGPSNSSATGYSPEDSPTVSSDGTVLYGVADFGGANDDFGTLFKMNTNGSNFVKLVDFNGTNGSLPSGTLTLSAYENILYGTTYAGGSNGLGIIFKVDTDGRNFVKLVDFDGVNKGTGPFGNLTLSPDGNTLYGVTDAGGANNHGVVYKVGIDGQNFQKLVDFDGPNKGNLPLGKIVLSTDGMLYGSTNQGGTKNLGVIFKVGSDGSGFKKLIDFDGFGGSNQGNNPLGNLNLSGNVLYGVTRSGGSANEGLIYKINTDGAGYKILISFDPDSLGGTPVDLTLSGNVLYGVTHKGGTHHQGIVYKVNTDGTSFTKLFNFGGADGNEPLAGPVISGNILYGMTPDGGSHDGGVVFKFTLPGITTGIRGSVTAKYKIYPNPVTDILYIKNELNTISKVEFISMYGQVVKSLINFSTEITIPTSNLAKGIYTIKIYDKAGDNTTCKILKQ